MNDEIKEILNILKDDIYIPLEDNREYKLLYKGDDKLLLDYITNLQQEIHKQIHTSIVQKKQINNLQKRNSRQRLANQKQQDLILKLQDENQRLKEDKKKAVEFIKTKGLKEEEWQNNFCIKATVTYTREEIFDLLNILQNGSEKDDR